MDLLKKLTKLATITLWDFYLKSSDLFEDLHPSLDFIQISGLKENEKYTIYNILSAEIKNGIISDNEKIDIRYFTNGLYFLKFENGTVFRFLKE